jgi:hypothetical protein
MSIYGSKDLVITLTDAGAVARDITQFVRTFNGIEIEALLEESHSYGDQWPEMIWPGFAKGSPVEIGGIYDDGANTPYALWSRGASRQMVITWGGGHTTTFTVLMNKWKRGPELEKAHKYTMTLMPSGAIADV